MSSSLTRGTELDSVSKKKKSKSKQTKRLASAYSTSTISKEKISLSMATVHLNSEMKIIARKALAGLAL